MSDDGTAPEPDATSHRGYFTYDVPVKPWALKPGDDRAVWARLLDHIVVAAAAETTPVAICAKLEAYLFVLFGQTGPTGQPVFNYTGNHNYWKGTTHLGLTIHTILSGTTVFELSRLVRDVYEIGGVGSYSCMDINGLLAMCSRALGVPLQLYAAQNLGEPKPASRLPSRPVRTGAADRDNWPFHMFCVLYDGDGAPRNEQDRDRSGIVFDALVRPPPGDNQASSYRLNPEGYFVAIDNDREVGSRDKFRDGARGIVPISFT